MLGHRLKNRRVIIFPLLVVLAIVIACGSSSTSAPDTTTDTTQPQPTAVTTTGGSPPSEDPLRATSVPETQVPRAQPTATTAAPAAAPKVARLQYAIGAVANETNRTWAGSRQAFVQTEPMLESMLAKGHESGLIVPRLATEWSANADMTEWTFKLREGVQFHNDWGEFTAADMLHVFKIVCRDDSLLSTCRDLAGRGNTGDDVPYEDIMDIVDDHNFVLRLGRTTSLIPFVMGAQSGEMAAWSVDAWNNGDLDFLDENGVQGTNTYQYVGRRPGQSIIMEEIPYDHWSGEKPDFAELEISWIPEDASRYAGLLAGEIHVTDLPVDLQQDGLTQGLSLIRSRFTSNDISVMFGGMYLSKDNPDSVAAFDPTIPWLDKRVRQAMILAVNQEELGNFLYADLWEKMYVDGFHPTLEGWDPTWPARYEAEMKYDPERARALLADAGYGPDNPVKVTANSYVSPGESELPLIIEAITLYWEKVGIDTKLQDLDGAEVANRYRGRKMQHQVWPNIIIYFPVEYWLNIAFTSGGPIHHYEDDVMDRLVPQLQASANPEERDRIAREAGNHLFNEFAGIHLFWFPHTIVADPDVVSDWIYPGNTVPRLCCPANAKAAR